MRQDKHYHIRITYLLIRHYNVSLRTILKKKKTKIKFLNVFRRENRQDQEK